MIEKCLPKESSIWIGYEGKNCKFVFAEMDCNECSLVLHVLRNVGEIVFVFSDNML